MIHLLISESGATLKSVLTTSERLGHELDVDVSFRSATCVTFDADEACIAVSDDRLPDFKKLEKMLTQGLLSSPEPQVRLRIISCQSPMAHSFVLSELDECFNGHRRPARGCFPTISSQLVAGNRLLFEIEEALSANWDFRLEARELRKRFIGISVRSITKQVEDNLLVNALRPEGVSHWSFLFPPCP